LCSFCFWYHPWESSGKIDLIQLYHSVSPIPNTLYRCIRLYIKNQHGRVGRVLSLQDYPEITEPI
jgi:hypothetical protein